MRRITFALAALTLVSTGLLRAADQSIPDAVAGEKLDPALYGEAVVESFDAAVARDLARATGAVVNPKARNGAHGAWLVPSRNATFHPHSGTHNLVNKWGDTRMGIGFPHPVTVDGAFVAAQGGRGAWTSGLRVVGYRSGEVVQTTDWFRAIGETPVWFAMRLTNVDRIVLEAESVQPDVAVWYALDDLTYTPVAAAPGETSQVVIEFEDCSYGQSLTDSTYAGLTWETGAGEFREVQIIHPPQAPPRPVHQRPDHPPPPPRPTSSSQSRSHALAQRPSHKTVPRNPRPAPPQTPVAQTSAPRRS